MDFEDHDDDENLRFFEETYGWTAIVCEHLGCTFEEAFPILEAMIALEDGRKVGVLRSTRLVIPLYRGLGFRTVTDFALYGPPDSFHV